MKKLIFTLLLIGSFYQLNASIPGFSKYHNMTGYFYCVKAFSQNKFILGGNDGRLLLTNDAGKHFIWLETNQYENIIAMDFIDEQKGILATDTGTVLITIDSCKTWKIVNVEKNIITNMFLLNDKTVFIAGRNNIYRSDDFGNNWQKIFSIDSTDIMSIFFLDENNGYAEGSNNLFIQTSDGGKTWKNYFKKNKNILFSGIYFKDINNGLISYSDTSNWSTAPNNSKLLRTKNAGETWDTISINFSQLVKKIQILSNGDNVVLGGPFILHSSDGWKSWKADSANFLKYNDMWPLKVTLVFIRDMSFYDNSNAILVGNESSYFTYSLDKGIEIKNFFNIGNVGSAITINGMNEMDDGTILAYGSLVRIFKNYDGNLFTQVFPLAPGFHTISDSLVNFWNNIYDQQSYLTSGVFPNNNLGYVFGNINAHHGLALYTTDEGDTWQFKDSLGCGFVSSYDNHSAISIFNYTGNFKYIYRSDDLSNKWTSSTITNQGQTLTDLQSVNDSTSFILTNYFEMIDDTIQYPEGYKYINTLLKSTNKGITFDTIYREDRRHREFRSIKFINENEGYLLHSMYYQNIILKTTDGGFTWLDYNVPIGTSCDIFINKNFILLCGLNDTLAYSVDYGKNWKVERLKVEAFSPKLGSIFYKIIPLKNGDLMLIGGGRLVRLLSDNPHTSVNNETTEKASDFILVYPNPVKNQLTLNLPIEYQSSAIKIYSIEGIEVLEMEYKDKIDVGGFSPGVYYVKVGDKVCRFVKM